MTYVPCSAMDYVPMSIGGNVPSSQCISQNAGNGTRFAYAPCLLDEDDYSSPDQEVTTVCFQNAPIIPVSHETGGNCNREVLNVVRRYANVESQADDRVSIAIELTRSQYVGRENHCSFCGLMAAVK